MIEKKADEIPVAPECGFYLNSIYFYLSRGCNLRCRHCWIEPDFQGKENLDNACIPLELIKKIIDQGKQLGLSSVKLTGGEPLIHPEIKEVLKYLARIGMRMNMETNGVLCTPEIAGLIKKCGNPMVSVSLDSSDPATHEWVRGVKGSFEKALTGLKNLLAEGINCQIIMSVMKNNVDHIEDMVKLAEETGANSLKFNIVTPTARGKEMHEKGETLSVEELVETGKWIENDLSKRTKVDLFYSHPVAFRPLHKIFSEGHVGLCGVTGIIGVLGNGKYALCGIGETVEEMIFGDARTDSLVEIWNNNPVLKAIREDIPEKLAGICGDCIEKNICLANCIASNYYHAQNICAPFWYCQEAFEKGIFPKSRIKPNSTSDKALSK